MRCDATQPANTVPDTQQSGTEFARTKENVAAIMRATQLAGTC